MENLVRFFLKRKVLVNAVIIAVFLMGVKALWEFPKTDFSPLRHHRIFITTSYPMAGPQQVEQQVTIPIEKLVQPLINKGRVISSSRPGLSLINITMESTATGGDLAELTQQIHNKLKQINLPKESTFPQVEQKRGDDEVIAEVALKGPLTELEKHGPYLQQELQGLSGVGRVDLVGINGMEWILTLNLLKMQELGISATYLKERLEQVGQGISLGSWRRGYEEQLILTPPLFNPVQILSISLKGIHGSTTLGQLATLDLSEGQNEWVVKYNGERGVGLLIHKTAESDTLKTIGNVKKRLNQILFPSSITYSLVDDRSETITDRLKSLLFNVLLGLLLMFFFLFILFDRRTATWTLFTLLFTFMGLIIMLPFLGISLDLFSIGSFVIVMGLILDLSIVVAEKIYHHKEKGMADYEAATKAVGHIWRPLLITTVIAVLVFVPLLILGGTVGKVMGGMTLAILFLLSFALLDSYFILPMQVLHSGKQKIDLKGWFVALEDRYQTFLRSCVRHRYLVLLLFTGALVSASWLLWGKLRQDSFPTDWSNNFYLTVEMKPGMSKEMAFNKIVKVENQLRHLFGPHLAGITTRIGTDDHDRHFSYQANWSYGVLKGVLQEGANEQLFSKVKEGMNQLGKDEALRLQWRSESVGPEWQRRGEIYVTSPSGKSREEISHSLLQTLTQSPLKIKEIGKHVIPAMDVWFKDSLERDQALFTAGSTTKLPASFPSAQMVRLKSYKSEESFLLRGKIPHEIIHYNSRPASHIQIQFDGPLFSSHQFLSQLIERHRPSYQSQVFIGGEIFDEYQVVQKGLLASMIIFIAIYLVMALIFDSFKTPLLVILAIPFMGVGVIWAYFLHGFVISFFSGIALLGLLGLILSNGLLLIHTMREMQEKIQLGRMILIDAAVSRLRPILATTLSTFLGLLPLAYGVVGYDKVIAPMCVGICYGLLFGISVLLFLIPCLYEIGNDLKKLKD